jgi:hypothetical protein
MTKITQFLKQYGLISYCVLSGFYGFTRSFNGKYEPPFDVIGHRMINSLANGFMYSLYSPYYYIKLLNRIDIKLSNKDPSKYKDSYKDKFSYNENVFV